MAEPNATDTNSIANDMAVAQLVAEAAPQQADGQPRAADNSSLRAQAMQYYGELLKALNERNPKNAEDAIRSLRGLANASGEVKDLIDGLLVNAGVAEAVVEQELTDNTVDSPTSASRYSGVRCCSRKVQDYFNEKLGAASFDSAEAEIRDGKVVGLRRGAAMDGEQVRAAFNDLARLGMTDDEQKKAQAEGQEAPRPLTQEEGQRVGRSLDTVERYRLGQIANDRSLSEEEKTQRAEAVRESFNAARGRLGQAMEIERRIDAAPSPQMREAARHGALPQREAARRALGESVRQDVIEGAVIEERPEARQRASLPVAPSRQPVQVAASPQQNGKVEIPQVPGRTQNVAAVSRSGGGMGMA